MSEKDPLRKNIYDDIEAIGEIPDTDNIPGEIVVWEREARGIEDVEGLVHQGEVGLKAQGFLDKGLSVGARLKSSGEISLFIAKHRNAIGGVATLAAGITTAAGVIILHKRRKK